ncbi:hypothetical protein KIN20_015566 [Parelaphostrongylus tenuis]|uniref:Uncharacterized protein n=1 Tax=Parelaphostrongylus tenuis TaxID=148309 RepID=A0AAD5MF50_PARTN|nr:hypothetical protein KIN20_015566 [Parelaphostrongylus tenuis]
MARPLPFNCVNMRLVLTYIFLVVVLVVVAVSEGQMNRIAPPFGDQRNIDRINHNGFFIAPTESTTKKLESVQLEKTQTKSWGSGDFGAAIDRIG